MHAAAVVRQGRDRGALARLGAAGRGHRQAVEQRQVGGRQGGLTLVADLGRVGHRGAVALGKERRHVVVRRAHGEGLEDVVVVLVVLRHRVGGVGVGADVAHALAHRRRQGQRGGGDGVGGAGVEVGGDGLAAEVGAPRGRGRGAEVVPHREVGGEGAGGGAVTQGEGRRELGARPVGGPGGRHHAGDEVEVRPRADADGVIGVVVVLQRLRDGVGRVHEDAEVPRAVAGLDRHLHGGGGDVARPARGQRRAHRLLAHVGAAGGGDGGAVVVGDLEGLAHRGLAVVDDAVAGREAGAGADGRPGERRQGVVHPQVGLGRAADGDLGVALVVGLDRLLEQVAVVGPGPDVGRARLGRARQRHGGGVEGVGLPGRKIVGDGAVAVEVGAAAGRLGRAEVEAGVEVGVEVGGRVPVLQGVATGEGGARLVGAAGVGHQRRGERHVGQRGDGDGVVAVVVGVRRLVDRAGGVHVEADVPRTHPGIGRHGQRGSGEGRGLAPGEVGGDELVVEVDAARRRLARAVVEVDVEVVGHQPLAVVLDGVGGGEGGPGAGGGAGLGRRRRGHDEVTRARAAHGDLVVVVVVGLVGLLDHVGAVHEGPQVSVARLGPGGDGQRDAVEGVVAARVDVGRDLLVGQVSAPGGARAGAVVVADEEVGDHGGAAGGVAHGVAAGELGARPSGHAGLGHVGVREVQVGRGRDRDLVEAVVVLLVGLLDVVGAVGPDEDVPRAVAHRRGHGQRAAGERSGFAGVEVGGHILVAQVGAPRGGGRGAVVEAVVEVGGDEALAGVQHGVLDCELLARPRHGARRRHRRAGDLQVAQAAQGQGQRGPVGVVLLVVLLDPVAVGVGHGVEVGRARQGRGRDGQRGAVEGVGAPGVDVAGDYLVAEVGAGLAVVLLGRAEVVAHIEIVVDARLVGVGGQGVLGRELGAGPRRGARAGRGGRLDVQVGQGLDRDVVPVVVVRLRRLRDGVGGVDEGANVARAHDSGGRHGQRRALVGAALVGLEGVGDGLLVEVGAAGDAVALAVVEVDVEALVGGLVVAGHPVLGGERGAVTVGVAALGHRGGGDAQIWRAAVGQGYAHAAGGAGHAHRCRVVYPHHHHRVGHVGGGHGVGLGQGGGVARLAAAAGVIGLLDVVDPHLGVLVGGLVVAVQVDLDRDVACGHGQAGEHEVQVLPRYGQVRILVGGVGARGAGRQQHSHGHRGGRDP